MKILQDMFVYGEVLLIFLCLWIFWIIFWGKYLWCSKTLFKLGCYGPALHSWFNQKETLKGVAAVKIRYMFVYNYNITYLFIGPVTNTLTNSCLVNFIDVTLACKDANSKLVDVVTSADVNAAKRVDESLVQIWKLKFSNEVKFCLDFEHIQGLVMV